MILLEKVNREFKEFRMASQVKQVITDLTVHIPEGECVGIIGSNGAGKSTVIRMIAGVLAPTKGRVRTFGVDPISHQRQLAGKMSVIFGTSSNLIDEATVEESFQITRKMYHISRNEFEIRYELLNDILDLDTIGRKTKEELSMGELRRASLAMGLLPESKLLILDEALIGLDSIRKQKILHYLKELNQQSKVTIIMTSHFLQDIQMICSRVLLLEEGKRQYYGTPEYLERNYAYEATIVITLMNQIPDLSDLAIESYSVTNHQLTINYHRKKISAKTILSHVLQQAEVENIKIQEQGLEDAILRIHKEQVKWT